MEDISKRFFIASTLNAVASAPLLASQHPTTNKTNSNSVTLPPAEFSIHALNRVTFGPTRQAVDEINAVGIKEWFVQQLRHHDELDDSEIESFIAANMPTVGMDISALIPQDHTQVRKELQLATLARQTYSPKQLFEVMVEFWSNHFNIYNRDSPLERLKVVDDREVIRANALGSFRDLLSASMHSPAMMQYLDNHLSTKLAPNENYARELLELHTLGVDGGYTQDDVINVSRVLTGWGIGRNANLGEFQFTPEAHDTEQKVVLGVVFPAGGGIEEGAQLVDILMQHPATARHIATKLVTRFVSDTPAESLVSKIAQRFLETDGDIQSILYTLFTSNEFFASADQKFKRPVEFLAAIFRALQIDYSMENLNIMMQEASKMNQLPFNNPLPTGDPDTMSSWLNSNATLNRWNIAALIAWNQIPSIGPQKILEQLPKSRRAIDYIDALSDAILLRELRPEDKTLYINYLNGEDRSLTKTSTTSRLSAILAMMLFSPYFQVR